MTHEEFNVIYAFYLENGQDKTLEKFKINSPKLHRLIKKFGVKALSRSEACKIRNKKRVEKNIEKYGAQHYVQTEEFKNKSIKTQMEKYGKIINFSDKETMANVITPEMNKKRADNTKKAIREKYGVDSILSVKSVRDKIKATCQEKYGGNAPMSDINLANKVRNTQIDRYGEHAIHIARKAALKNIRERKTKELLKRLSDHNYKLIGEFKGLQSGKKGKDIWQKYKIHHIICGNIFEDDVFEIPRCPKCFPWRGGKDSILERTIADFIENDLGFEVIRRSRELIYDDSVNQWLELDIYIPSLKIGFETNGTYYHSALFKDSNYHKRKTENALNAGIKIYHIWEYMDLGKVKSKIRAILGKSEKRMYARKFEIVVENGSNSEFFKDNHLYGSASAVFSVSLKLDDAIYASLSIRKNKNKFEIARYCTLSGHSIHGAFSRLLKGALVELKSRGFSGYELITYADRDFTPDVESCVYSKYFKFIKYTKPSMYFTNFNTVYHRTKFINKEIPHNIHKLYNSGNLLFSTII